MADKESREEQVRAFERRNVKIYGGILLVVALIVIVWAVGFAKSARHEKAALDKMRAKDL